MNKPRAANNGAELTGQRFGRLQVMCRVENTKHDKRQWACTCDCGANTIVPTGQLRSGHTQSCGCLITEVNTKHGMHASPEYGIWGQMKARCNNPGTDKYERYGGRGITVCQRWQESFAAFHEDMGPRPSPEHTVERRENNGHYAPDNCYWATWHTQYRNRRQTVWLEFNGERLCQKDWCRRYNLDEGTFTARLKRGWTLERALTLPAQRQHANGRALLKGA